MRTVATVMAALLLAAANPVVAQDKPADPADECTSPDPCTALINGGTLSQLDLGRALARRSSLLKYTHKDDAAADSDRARGLLTGLVDGGTSSQFDLAIALATRASLAPDDAPDSAIADFSRAIDILKKTGGHAPELGRMFLARSYRYEARRDPKLQVADLTEALRVQPDLPIQHTLALAYEDLSLYYRKLGNFDGAIKAATSALTYDPNETNAYVLRGDMKRFVSDYAGARQDFDAALRVNPKNPLAHLYLGEMIYTQDISRYEETIQQYEQALAITPQIEQVVRDESGGIIPWAYLKRGQALSAKGDNAGAVEALNHAVALGPGIVQAYNNRGVAYYGLRQYDAAVTDLNKALQLRPDFATARENLAVVQQAQQQEQQRLAQQQLAQQQLAQQQAAERQRQQQVAEQQRRQAQNNANNNALTRLILGGVAAAAGADANTVASTLNGTYSAPPPAPVPQQPINRPAAPSVSGNVTACVYLANGELHNTCDFQVEVLIAFDGVGPRGRELYRHEDFPLTPDAATLRMNLPITTLPMDRNPRVLLACVGGGGLQGTTGANGDAGVARAYCAR